MVAESDHACIQIQVPADASPYPVGSDSGMFWSIVRDVYEVKAEMKVLDWLGSEVKALSTEMKAVDTKVDGLGTEVKALGTEVKVLGTEMKGLDAKCDRVEERTDKVGEKLEAKTDKSDEKKLESRIEKVANDSQVVKGGLEKMDVKLTTQIGTAIRFYGVFLTILQVAFQFKDEIIAFLGGGASS